MSISSGRPLDIKVVGEIRDPIFKYIQITDYEEKIIDSSIFQRLDRIPQMQTASLVYPNARYFRKAHSLGVMHLMHHALLHLLILQMEGLQTNPFLSGDLIVKPGKEKLQDISASFHKGWAASKDINEIVQSARIAGLLHDLGHAPFSHLFEDICKEMEIKMDFDGKEIIFDHELMTRKIISEKYNELNFMAPITPEHINEILDPEGAAPTFLHELIDSPYDCDKLDYLMRDAYHAGTTEYGLIDLERILDGFRVVKEALCISESAIDALSNSFDAVQYMYTTVYYHKTSRIFDFMVADALRYIPDFLQEIVSNVDKFLEYDDYSIVCEIKHRAEAKNEHSKTYEKAYEIFKDLMQRKKHYRKIFEHRFTPTHFEKKGLEERLEKFEKELLTIADKLKIIVDYRPHIRPIGIKLEQIPEWLSDKRIHNPDTGELKTIEEISKGYREKLGRYVTMFRVYGNCDQLENDTDKKYEIISKKIKESCLMFSEQTERILK